MNEEEVKNLSSSMSQLAKQLEKNNAALLLASKETKNIEKETEKINKNNKTAEKSYKTQTGFLSTMVSQMGKIYSSAFKFSGLIAKIGTGTFAATIIKDMVDLDDTMTAVSARMGKGGKDVNVVGKNLFEMSQQSKKASNNIKELNKEMLSIGEDGSFNSSTQSAKELNDELANTKSSMDNLSSGANINFSTNFDDIKDTIESGPLESGLTLYADSSEIDSYLSGDKSTNVSLKPLNDEIEKSLATEKSQYVKVHLDNGDLDKIASEDITKEIKLESNIDDFKKNLEGESIEVEVNVNEKQAQDAINNATNTQTAVNNVQLLKDSVIDLQKEYGTSYENAKTYVAELAKMKFEGNIRDAAAGVDLYSRSTGVAAGLTMELTDTLSKGAGMSAGAINSMYAGMAKVQQQVGISEKGMTALTQTINEMAANMTAFGKGSKEIKQMAIQTTALVGALENVGISAQRSTQLINQLTDPDRIEDNILLYSQLGISMEEAMSGDFNLDNFDGQLKDMAQRIVDMGPIAGSSFAKSMGMTYKEAQRMASLEEGSMDAMGEAAKTTEEQSLDTLKQLVTNTEGFGKTMETQMNKLEGFIKGMPKTLLIGLLVLGPALVALGRSLIAKMFNKKKIQASVADGAKDGVKDIEKGAIPSLENTVKKANDKIKGQVKAAAPSMGKTFATWFTGTAVGGWLNGTEAKMDALYKRAKAKPLSKAWLQASDENLANQAQAQIEKAQAKADTLAAQIADLGGDIKDLSGADTKDIDKLAKEKGGGDTRKEKAIKALYKEYQKTADQAKLLEQAELRRQGYTTKGMEQMKSSKKLQEEIAKRKQSIADKEKKITDLVGGRYAKTKNILDIQGRANNLSKKEKELTEQRIAAVKAGDSKKAAALREQELLIQKARKAADEELKNQEDQLKGMDKELAKLKEEKKDLEDIKKLKGAGSKATDLNGLEAEAKQAVESAEKGTAEQPKNKLSRLKKSLGNKISGAAGKTEWGKAAAASIEKQRQSGKEPGKFRRASAYGGRALLAAVKGVGKATGKGLGKLGKTMGKGFGKMAKGLGGILKNVGPLAILGMIMGKLMEKIKEPLEKALDQVINVLSPIIDALMPVIGTLLNVVATKILPPVLHALAGILDMLGFILKPIIAILRMLGKLPWIGGAFSGIADALEQVTSKSVTDSLRTAADNLSTSSFSLEKSAEKQEEVAEEQEEGPEVITSDDGGKLVSNGTTTMEEQETSVAAPAASVNPAAAEDKSEEKRKEKIKDDREKDRDEKFDTLCEMMGKTYNLIYNWSNSWVSQKASVDPTSTSPGTIVQ